MQPSVLNGTQQRNRPTEHAPHDTMRLSGRESKRPAEPAELPGGAQGAPKPAPSASPIARMASIVGVSAIEGLSIYAWLRLHDAGRPWWALLALLVGQVAETALLQRAIDRGGVKRWGPAPTNDPRAASYMRKVERRIGAAGNAEVALWVLWLACAMALGQEIAAVGLLVAMHVKHQVEHAAVCDTTFRTGLFSFKAIVGSAMEVASAVACLALIIDGHYVTGAVVLGVGLLVEHAMLIDSLRWEIVVRDIRLPRDRRWRTPVRPSPAATYLASHYASLWRLVQRITPLQRWLNRTIINSRIGRIEPRPNPLSTVAPYTSWTSLTDRTYSSRHLPPVPADAQRSPAGGPPASGEVAKLFLRDKEMIACPKSTVLFGFFAQWFTDGFLRTRREEHNGIRDTLRNESNHEIDLAQLYGLNSKATRQLRGERGLLKSQLIDGEEYPPYYCSEVPGDEPTPSTEFDELPRPVRFDSLKPEQKRSLFAMGSDTRNLGFAAFNVLFLREHNRIARQLGAEYPAWDGDRVFETSRNILTVVLLKIVVDEFINHINPNHFQFRFGQGGFHDEPWYRPNWMAIEFNLLYRWHSLAPSTFHLAGTPLPMSALLSDTTVLTSTGLGPIMAAASNQPAGRLGLRNTDRDLIDMAERPSIEQARVAELAPYNDYRRLCRLPPVASFAEISSDPDIQAQLERLYPGGVEDVEFYVGLFAEEAGPNSVLPPLVGTMVAFDAFSQALTNPLLARRVFNEQTFSPLGMKVIEQTSCLSDLVQRNVPRRTGQEPYFVSLRRRDFQRV